MRALLLVLAVIPVHALAQCQNDHECPPGMSCIERGCVERPEESESAEVPAEARSDEVRPGSVGAAQGVAKAARSWEAVVTLHPVAAVATSLALSRVGIGAFVLPVELAFKVHREWGASARLTPIILTAQGTHAGGLEAGMSVRYFPWRTSPGGAWAGVTAQGGAVPPLFYVEALAELGYQWIHASGFTAGASLGIAVGSLEETRVRFSLNFPIGWAF